MCHHECRSRTHLAVAREQTLLYGCKEVLEGLKFTLYQTHESLTKSSASKDSRVDGPE